MDSRPRIGVPIHLNSYRMAMKSLIRGRLRGNDRAVRLVSRKRPLLKNEGVDLVSFL